MSKHHSLNSYSVHLRASPVDKTNFIKKNEFGSFANANFNGGMYHPKWTTVDKPSPITKEMDMLA